MGSRVRVCGSDEPSGRRRVRTRYRSRTASKIMTDIFTAERRGQIMSRIRSRQTGPELRLHEVVRLCLGPRWKVDTNVRTLPGQPDIVVPSLRVALFADGCFYHCCPVHGHIPKSNVAYWKPKLARNIRRDALLRRKLRTLGFSVWKVWEHDLRASVVDRTAERLGRRLRARIMSVRESVIGN